MRVLLDECLPKRLKRELVARSNRFEDLRQLSPQIVEALLVSADRSHHLGNGFHVGRLPLKALQHLEDLT